MNSDMTTARTLTTAAKIRRMLAVLAIVIAMVAISALSPGDAGAMRRTEAGVNQMCHNAGGSVDYDFPSGSFMEYEMTCSLPSGHFIFCFGGGWNNTLMCY